MCSAAIRGTGFPGFFGDINGHFQASPQSGISLLAAVQYYKGVLSLEQIRSVLEKKDAWSLMKIPRTVR